MLHRRNVLAGAVGGTAAWALRLPATIANEPPPGVALAAPDEREDIFAFLRRTRRGFDLKSYQQILGAANPFKEGDQTVGVAARDDTARSYARQLLANTRLDDIERHAFHRDQLFVFSNRHREEQAAAEMRPWTLGQLKQFLLTSTESAIRAMMSGLSSDVISCVVKLMSNDELISVGQNVFNPLPGSQIGARGYLGARVQPNSPTDHVDDIRWQVFDAWSYAVGDVLLGNNPVASTVESVLAIERTLQDLLRTFQVDELLPHCVLSHIDVQAEVEAAHPGSTALWFQSIGGCDSANKTFDISVDALREYASNRTDKFGLYFETGQGADFTNGHSHGFDMVMHESRKYGLARALTRVVGDAQRRAGRQPRPWVHLNDVAGFIGPEVFRTREQLVRCCLEDIVMGKLHGLCLGLDVCSTLHMDVTLDDLDWCLDQIMPANPAYLMALPTKIDPMLGYLTTGFHDHVRIREKFGYRVSDPVWKFFHQLGVIDDQDQPTRHFGDPVWIYLQYRRRKGDQRIEADIRREAQQQLGDVRSRGVFIARGHGARPGDLEPTMKANVQHIYDDAKQSIWAELKPEFIASIPHALALHTNSQDRNDYILHPQTGEQIAARSATALQKLRQEHAERYDVQVLISDGLNALAISDPGQLQPFLEQLRQELQRAGYRAAPDHLVLRSGRVRAGYRIGESLFGQLKDHRAILHVIGERPGTGHHTFSVYITAPAGSTWSKAGTVDHDITKVVSGIATTALDPQLGAVESVKLLKTLTQV